MASEDGAGIVSNVGYDVNNTIQRAAESIGSETADGTPSETTWHVVAERTADRASDPASNSPGTPTGFPAASPFHANTEGHALRRDSDPASSCGDVEERVTSESDNETQQPSHQQQRNMSHQRTDPDGTACLPGEPDGNLVSCHSLLCKAFSTVFFLLSRQQSSRNLHFPRLVLESIFKCCFTICHVSILYKYSDVMYIQNKRELDGDRNIFIRFENMPHLYAVIIH